MRGEDKQQHELFSFVSLEDGLPRDYLPRPIRARVEEALKLLSRKFDATYGSEGRPSIAPERLLRALLLQMHYTVRSDRVRMERLDFNLLFRWFAGISMIEEISLVTFGPL